MALFVRRRDGVLAEQSLEEGATERNGERCYPVPFVLFRFSFSSASIVTSCPLFIEGGSWTCFVSTLLLLLSISILWMLSCCYWASSQLEVFNDVLFDHALVLCPGTLSAVPVQKGGKSITVSIVSMLGMAVTGWWEALSLHYQLHVERKRCMRECVLVVCVLVIIFWFLTWPILLSSSSLSFCVLSLSPSPSLSFCVSSLSSCLFLLQK